MTPTVEQWGEEPVLTRARAAARLRARDGLASADRRAVRDARGEIGAALRRARRARATSGVPTITVPVVSVAATARPQRRLLPGALALLIVIAGLLAAGPRDEATAEAGGAPPAPEIVPASVARESTSSRGRSFGTVAFVAVAEPTPEAPDPAPQPAAAAPVPAAPGAVPAATGGNGTGGGSTSGTGPGGNSGGTSPAPTATEPPPTPAPAPQATPTPTPTVGSRPAGMARFTGRVVDSRTGGALNGVCVIVGVRACNERDVYTDGSGRFTIDLPIGADWDVNFGQTGYATAYRRIVSSAPRTTDIGTIRLTPRP